MKELLDDVSITRSLKRMAHEIVEKNKGCDNLVLVGIKTRGEFLAKRICDYIYDFENERVECDSLDITYWRDDMDDKPNIIPLFKTDVKAEEITFPDQEATEAKWVTINELLEMSENDEIISGLDFIEKDYELALEKIKK